MLHWGHYAELGNPWPSEVVMRREIAYVKSLGFKLIKFCLWVPPPRYYELCDELGMLVWQEYPVWDAPLEDRAIVEEYREFFRQDGPYPCVILRTLTCENDRVDPGLGRDLVDLGHEMIPGSLILDNSGWLCTERAGDFHDEHPYLNNVQWLYYGGRMRGKLTKPLLLGETMAVDALPGRSRDLALAVRRFQTETIAHDLPDAGYVTNVIRDTHHWAGGFCTLDGTPKLSAAEWSWHRDDMTPARRIPPLRGPVIGPRKGQWKCAEYTRATPAKIVVDPSLPVELIERELLFDLLSGRILENWEGTRVLVEMRDFHGGHERRLPRVIEFATQGVRRVVSALRHDTPAGRALWEILQARSGPAPEIGPLAGTSLTLEDWELSVDGQVWVPVKYDTALVNAGRNVFEGSAVFRTSFDFPGGCWSLHCAAVGDYYEFYIDGVWIAEAGPRSGTWDGARETPRDCEVELSPGRLEIEFHVRDWRAAGGMVGPVCFARSLNERVL